MTVEAALTPEEARVRRAHAVVTVGLLLGCALTYLLTVLLTADQLPARLAIHFGLDGQADNWMSRPVALGTLGLLALGIPTFLLVVAAAGQWWRGSSARFTSSFVAGLASTLVSLFVSLLLAQRGLEDSEQVRLDPTVLLWALAAGLVVGGLAWVLLPRDLPQPEPVVAQPMEISPSDRVTWFGRAVPGRLAGMLTGGTAVLMAVLGLVVQEWWAWLMALLVALLVPATMVYRVTVDRRGLTWRSALGWPRGHLPLAEITGATVVIVRPGDFGGFGMRSAPGATGLITRSGQALSVSWRQPTSDRDRRLVITVDDALTAAQVIEGLRLTRSTH